LSDEFFKVPEGMTEDEVLVVMKKVIDKVAPKWVFFGYELDDIKQESYFICADGINRYNGDFPLENFLSVHLHNRLFNFVRREHGMKDLDDEKKKVLRPAQLEYSLNIPNDNDGCDYSTIDYSEMVRIINHELPSSMRQDWLKLANDVPISKPRRDDVLNTAESILEEHGFEKG
jgi:hypothetical protein